MNVSASDRSTIAKLLGLIGSNHDAEALAAARKAHALLKARNGTWPEVLGLGEAPPEPDHAALARDLLGRGKGICTRWEMDFLRGVLAFKALSDQQRRTLDGIRDKVDAANMENDQPTD
jgi:hypothetical protein